MKYIAIVVLTVGVLAVAGCGGQPAPPPTAQPLATPLPSERSPTQAAPPTISPTEDPFESPLVPADDAFESPIGLPNPASVYCQQQGYDLEMRTDDAGTTGYCIFADGTECEEWAYFRGECAPGTPAP